MKLRLLLWLLLLLHMWLLVMRCRVRGSHRSTLWVVVHVLLLRLGLRLLGLLRHHLKRREPRPGSPRLVGATALLHPENRGVPSLVRGR